MPKQAVDAWYKQTYGRGTKAFVKALQEVTSLDATEAEDVIRTVLAGMSGDSPATESGGAAPQQGSGAEGPARASGETVPGKNDPEPPGKLTEDAKPPEPPAQESGVAASEPSRVVNPIDPALSNQEKLAAIARLTSENKPILDGWLKRMDSELGTTSESNVKKDATILDKATRPETLAKYPWFGVEHVRDTLRFKTVVDDFAQIGPALKWMASQGIEPVKLDTEKLFNPGTWGWRFVGLDVRMPNGQLVEWYLPLREMEAAKNGECHDLFEKWRSASKQQIQERLPEYTADVQRSRKLYQEAFDSVLARLGLDANAARASFTKSLSSSGVTDIASLSSFAEGARSSQVPLTRTQAKSELNIATSPSDALPTSSAINTSLQQEGSSAAANRITKGEREALGLDEMDAPVREHLEEWLDKAKEDYSPDRADSLAESILKAPRVLTEAESATLTIRKVEIRKAFDQAVADGAKAINEGGSFEEIQASRALSEDLRRKFDTVSQALVKAGSEWGRAGVARRMEIDQDYGLVGLLQRATVAKNGSLTPEEVAKFTDLAAKLEKLEAEVAQLRETKAAESANVWVARERAKRGQSTTRGKILAERSALLKELTRVSSSMFAGLDPQLAVIAVKLAKNFVADGVDTLGELVGKVQEAFDHAQVPASERDIRDAISGYGREPSGSVGLDKGRGELRLARLQKIARLTSELEDLTAGMDKPKRIARRSADAEVADLLAKIKEIRAARSAARSRARTIGRSQSKALDGLWRLEERRDELRKALGMDAGGTAGEPTPEAIYAVKAEIKDLRRQIYESKAPERLQEQLAKRQEVLDALRRGEVVDEPKPSTSVDPAAEILRKQLDEVNKEIRALKQTPDVVLGLWQKRLEDLRSGPKDKKPEVDVPEEVQRIKDEM
ncbi:MAG: hypothetical protein ACOYON_16355, partial [Fimbriimonas sp.]